MSRPGPGTGTPYRNPLRSATVTPERVDQGVDYSGYGPIHAVGRGRILEVLNPGWPGGTFIAEELAGGPDAGSIVYVAEDVTPAVHIGQEVTTRTVLGELHGGLETGWGAPEPNLGESLAAATGQGHTGLPTAWGQDYSQFLASLGAEPGILHGRPSGTITPGAPGATSAGSGGSLLGGLGNLAIIVPIVLAGLAVGVWGAARATGTSKYLSQARHATAPATRAKELAATL